MVQMFGSEEDKAVFPSVVELYVGQEDTHKALETGFCISTSVEHAAFVRGFFQRFPNVERLRPGSWQDERLVVECFPRLRYLELHGRDGRCVLDLRGCMQLETFIVHEDSGLQTPVPVWNRYRLPDSVQQIHLANTHAALECDRALPNLRNYEVVFAYNAWLSSNRWQGRMPSAMWLLQCQSLESIVLHMRCDAYGLIGNAIARVLHHVQELPRLRLLVLADDEWGPARDSFVPNESWILGKAWIQRILEAHPQLHVFLRIPSVLFDSHDYADSPIVEAQRIGEWKPFLAYDLPQLGELGTRPVYVKRNGEQV